MKRIQIKQLFSDIPNCTFIGQIETEITGISSNSKKIQKGDLFIAKKGLKSKGSSYSKEAIESGAVAILSDVEDYSLPPSLQIIHPHPGQIEGRIASKFFNDPSQELMVVGITGTNGKTTTSYIVKYLLDSIKSSCGLIGTIENIVGGNHYRTTHTTPDVITNHQLLHEMVKAGCHSVVMEVTSHALDQGRVDQIDFDVAIFTNLTHEHLDYHENMENYCCAKNRLFRELGKEKKKPTWAVINQDDPWKTSIIEGSNAQVLTYGIQNGSDLQAVDIQLQAGGTMVKLHYQGKSLDCFWPLTGRYNVYNCLAAIAVCLTQNFSLELIVSKMLELPFIKGRLQAVSNQLGLKIFVDYAHSEDALKKVLCTLREIQTTGRLMVAFGCGGNRDRTKRSKMAQAAESFADYCMVTSDNPRDEDPQEICNEIISGFSPNASYEIELDRLNAIEKIIRQASPGDIILIAGKGHEDYQIFSDRTIEFDDYKMTKMICDQISQLI